jgi:hypothetical protein
MCVSDDAIAELSLPALPAIGAGPYGRSIGAPGMIAAATSKLGAGGRSRCLVASGKSVRAGGNDRYQGLDNQLDV